jgi:HD-GYP domain-containing protein (c-di-GMP phosphodiesterase class II)
MAKKGEQTLLLEMTVFGVLSLVFFLGGTYFLLWRPITESGDLEWQYLGFALIFLAMTITMLFYFRKNLLLLNMEMEKRLAMQKKHLEQLNRTCEGILRALNYALDYRDHETWGHSSRVVGYALAIGRAMRLADEELTRLAWGGFLHDIGKIGIPDSILFKAAPLDLQEWEIVKRHPVLGHEIINQIDFLQATTEIVLYHHEHYNGKGYPHALKGEEIPLPARIFAVADALDAMTSNRPYRPARSLEEALAEIKRLSGEQFCPRVVKALFSIGKNKLKAIQANVSEDGSIGMFGKGLAGLILLNRESG